MTAAELAPPAAADALAWCAVQRDVDLSAVRPDPSMLDEGDPQRGRPGMAACERCGLLTCSVCAVVTWVVDARRVAAGREFVRVGRACLEDAVVDLARVERVDGTRVDVEVPVWAPRYAALAAFPSDEGTVADGRLAQWFRAGYVEPWQGCYPADQIIRGRRMAELVRAGVRAQQACEVVVHGPAERRHVVLAVLRSARDAAEAARAVTR